MHRVIRSLSLFSRFCTVGVSNTVIDFSVFFLFISLGVPYLLSQILSFTTGMINSFIWNRKWTFKVKNKIKMSEITRFIILNLLALTSINFLLSLLYEEMGWSLLVSKMAATSIGVIITFIGSRLWVFQRSELKEG